MADLESPDSCRRSKSASYSHLDCATNEYGRPTIIASDGLRNFSQSHVSASMRCWATSAKLIASELTRQFSKPTGTLRRRFNVEARTAAANSASSVAMTVEYVAA